MVQLPWLGLLAFFFHPWVGAYFICIISFLFQTFRFMSTYKQQLMIENWWMNDGYSLKRNSIMKLKFMFACDPWVLLGFSDQI
jgi:hypothetical protein